MNLNCIIISTTVILSFISLNSNKNASKEIKVFDKENHFSIILKSPYIIGSWLEKSIK